MSAENQSVVTRAHVLSLLGRKDENRDLAPQRPDGEHNSNMVELSRNVITSVEQGIVSQQEFKYLVTSQCEYAQLQRGRSGMSDSLVAAFSPYSAKGRAIRYLAARIMLENASTEALCFSVSGAHKKCGASYVAANLAVAFSEFGLRTLLIDANLSRPNLQRLFASDQAQGLSTSIYSGGSPLEFVNRLPFFRELSLLTAGRHSRRAVNLLGNGVLANLLRAVRHDYDVVICDSPAMATANDNCEVVAGICHKSLSVLRKSRTRVSSARAMLAALDAVGAQPLGSVLCEF